MLNLIFSEHLIMFAPEVLKGSYDQKWDIWNIGAITYLLLCDKPQFNVSTYKEIFNSILNSDVKFYNTFLII